MDRSSPLKSSNKTLDLAVNAIQTIRELPGSSSKDIINYITKNYAVEKDTISKQVKASLRRGLAYGILRQEGGRYSLPIETDAAGEEIATQEIQLIEMCRRKRGRRKKMHKRSSKETAAVSRKRCCGKNCPCNGAIARRSIKKRKSGNQDLRTADSCCCIHYKSYCQRMRRPKKFINKRDDSRNADELITEYSRRKSTRLEQRNKRDARCNQLKRSKDS